MSRLERRLLLSIIALFVVPAALGSLILGLADAFGAQLWPGLAKFTPWIVMAGVLLWRPEGLMKEA